MKRPNTKKHWTALTLARYYDEHQTAARARDLWPVLKEIYDDPNNLNRALNGLRKDDFIDHVPVKSPSRDGGKTKTFAYYPTKTTIEQLRDIGEPTEMPDGSAIPDDINPSLTTSRATEGDNVDLPPSDVMAPEYQTSYAGDGQRPTSYSKRDTTHISEDPVADLADDEADDESDDDDDKHVCPYCGDTFDTPNGLGGHKGWCEEGPNADRKPSDDAPDADLPPVEQTEFEPATTDGQHADPGALASEVNLAELARGLELTAQEAHANGMTDVAAAYSQFAALAAEDNLGRRAAFILLGVPVLDIEDGPIDGDDVQLPTDALL